MLQGKSLKDMFPRIRATVLMIPRGKVSSYGAVARAAGFPGAARQVVWALRSARGLPWHRVVAAGGRIALPGEAGFEQRLRLESEGVLFSGSRVKMSECEHVFAHPKATTARTKMKTPAGRKSAGKQKRRRP
jgi:methylated-DNA-protein-cysteine methyltransferase related protein